MPADAPKPDLAHTGFADVTIQLSMTRRTESQRTGRECAQIASAGVLQPRAREAGFFGARDGRASINFRVLYQLIKAGTACFTLAREAGFFGARDGHASIIFRVQSQLVKA